MWRQLLQPLDILYNQARDHEPTRCYPHNQQVEEYKKVLTKAAQLLSASWYASTGSSRNVQLDSRLPSHCTMDIVVIWRYETTHVCGLFPSISVWFGVISTAWDTVITLWRHYGCESFGVSRFTFDCWCHDSTQNLFSFQNDCRYKINSRFSEGVLISGSLQPIVW